MFTGIIESQARVRGVTVQSGNKRFILESPLAAELKPDQSVAHDGICLTVEVAGADFWQVTAIAETLERTTMASWKEGTLVNMERCMKLGDRLDGHIVQGHVDQVASCVLRRENAGSWIFGFEYEAGSGNVTVQKGSICINGVSLTVVESGSHSFSVHIIPYTYEHTGFRDMRVGDAVNLEFDIVGKYIARLMPGHGSGIS